jgi:hypothetical protein
VDPNLAALAAIDSVVMLQVTPTSAGGCWRRLITGSNEDYAIPIEWDPGNWKADCGANAAMTGLSTSPSGSGAHGIYCTPYSSHFTGNYVRSLSIAGGNLVSQRMGDWDLGYYKAECGLNEYVSGVSIDPSSKVTHSLRCAQGDGLTSGGGSACETHPAMGQDDRGYTGSDDWDLGFAKSECSSNKVVYGVSIDTGTQMPHRILCCSK